MLGCNLCNLCHFSEFKMAVSAILNFRRVIPLFKGFPGWGGPFPDTDFWIRGKRQGQIRSQMSTFLLNSGKITTSIERLYVVHCLVSLNRLSVGCGTTPRRQLRVPKSAATSRSLGNRGYSLPTSSKMSSDESTVSCILRQLYIVSSEMRHGCRKSTGPTGQLSGRASMLSKIAWWQALPRSPRDSLCSDRLSTHRLLIPTL